MPDFSQLARYVALCYSQAEDPGLDYQCEESGMTIQDALVAYRTYARAEGKSPKTIKLGCLQRGLLFGGHARTIVGLQ